MNRRSGEGTEFNVQCPFKYINSIPTGLLKGQWKLTKTLEGTEWLTSAHALSFTHTHTNKGCNSLCAHGLGPTPTSA